MIASKPWALTIAGLLAVAALLCASGIARAQGYDTEMDNSGFDKRLDNRDVDKRLDNRDVDKRLDDTDVDKRLDQSYDDTDLDATGIDNPATARQQPKSEGPELIQVDSAETEEQQQQPAADGPELIEVPGSTAD